MQQGESTLAPCPEPTSRTTHSEIKSATCDCPANSADSFCCCERLNMKTIIAFTLQSMVDSSATMPTPSGPLRAHPHESADELVKFPRAPQRQRGDGVSEKNQGVNRIFPIHVYSMAGLWCKMGSALASRFASIVPLFEPVENSKQTHLDKILNMSKYGRTSVKETYNLPT